MNTPITDVVAELDSHTIYARDDILVDLRAAGYTGPFPEGMSHRQMVGAIKDRGLGGSLGPDDGMRLIAGYSVAQIVAGGTAGRTPGDRYHGRGSAYRANVEAIREWEVANRE